MIVRHHALSALHTRIDGIGAIAATACAVHCLAMPMLATLLPALGLGLLASETFETVMIASSASLAIASAGWGYRRHRNAWAVLWVIAAASLLVSGGFVFNHAHEAHAGSHHEQIGHAPDAAAEPGGPHDRAAPGPGLLLVVAGGFGLALGHGLNHRLCRRCLTCATARHPPAG